MAASSNNATNSNIENKQSCKCLPYKDPVFIIAQSLALVGFALSWNSYFTLAIAFIGFILLQVAWCCKLNKCGLVTAGAFCVLAGFANIGYGIYFVTHYVGAVQVLDDYYVVDDYYGPYVYVDYSPAAKACAFVGGALMTTAGIMTLVFACGRRLQKQLARDEEDDDGVIHVVATPIQDNTTFSSASNYSSPKNPGSAAPTSGTPTAYVQRAPDEEAPSDAKPPSYAPPARSPGVNPKAVPTPGAYQMPHAGLFQKN